MPKKKEDLRSVAETTVDHREGSAMTENSFRELNFGVVIVV